MPVTVHSRARRENCFLCLKVVCVGAFMHVMCSVGQYGWLGIFDLCIFFVSANYMYFVCQ